VSDVEVSLERERALVDYDPDALMVPQMVEAIQRSVILPRFRRAIEHTARPRRGRQVR
jgi:hypothetical protein